MPDSDILRLNSKNLKNFFAPINPYFGDPNDPHRILLNVKGIKKAFLPCAMANLPLLKKIFLAGSLSKFIRSNFFKQNFLSVSHLLSQLYELRLKYDFYFWIAEKVPYSFPLENYRSLINNLSYHRWCNNPLRLIIRKNRDQDISFILNLFIIWFKTYSLPNTNVMFLSPKSSENPYSKQRFLDLMDSLHHKEFYFSKKNPSTLFHPSSRSKFWFFSPNNPDACRSLDFSCLLLLDIGRWNKQNSSHFKKVIKATFPVIPASLVSAIILESGPINTNSSFYKEFYDDSINLSGFSIINIPWYHSTSNFFRFDFPQEKINFFKDLYNSRDKKSLTYYPRANPGYLYSLWLKGIPLEALHWYATEASFFKSLPPFLNAFPP